ncbi:unnamed protein product [Adineta ricciae]|uniref:Uncharacterized protein n=1 Tax=Adineta ricciae TaxID=249248 RepID=A0A815U7S9_ADIRI|nr:unnamed protein product [Adineta ricciae]CAF1631776.1 unnamed protein product [Adineta ricciae]
MKTSAPTPRFTYVPRLKRAINEPDASSQSATTSIICILLIVTGCCRFHCDYESTSCPTCDCLSVSISLALDRIRNGSATPPKYPINNIAPCVNHTFRNTLTVYDGIHMLSDFKAAQNRSVSATWYHPNCELDVLDNEIAILRSSSDFTGTINVSLACLSPPTNDSKPSNHEEASCSSNTIKICAGRGAADGCDDVSGGHIIPNVNNSWTIIEIISYPSLHSHYNGSSIFTRISYYQSLIDMQLRTIVIL